MLQLFISLFKIAPFKQSNKENKVPKKKTQWALSEIYDFSPIHCCILFLLNLTMYIKVANVSYSVLLSIFPRKLPYEFFFSRLLTKMLPIWMLTSVQFPNFLWRYMMIVLIRFHMTEPVVSMRSCSLDMFTLTL